MCVQATRLARICIEDSYNYACQRSTFGKKLIEHPIIRAKFAHMIRLVQANHATNELITYHCM